jgi:hypothetical protein
VTRIGWYIHHHGFGHMARFLAVRPHLNAEVDVFSSLPRPAVLPTATTWTHLARDDDPIETSTGPVAPDVAHPTARGLLHWAPLHHDGHRARLAAIADTVRDRSYDSFVVDVSAEVTVFVRLLGVPVAVFTQPGDRGDRPHRLAFDAADTIIAPWPERLYSAPYLQRVRSRVTWTGGISRFADSPRPQTRPGVDGPVRVLVLGRVAGSSAATSLPTVGRLSNGADGRVEWRSVGADDETWTDDPASAMLAADVVVSAAGQNSVADLAAVRARAIVLPQARPFEEQQATGLALARASLAVVLDRWPAPSAWASRLEEAMSMRPDWSLWETDGAPARAAAAIMRTAARNAVAA